MFDRVAAKLNFSPLEAEKWYTVTFQDVKKIKVIISIISRRIWGNNKTRACKIFLSTIEDHIY
jgi:hypothetical protein